MSLFSENGIYYTIVTIAIVLIANTLGDKIKNAINPNNEDELIRKYLLNENPLYGYNRPKLWIHTTYEYNARKWKSFGSRSSTDLNQPYLHLTIKTIINKCGDDFNVCLIDDDSFSQLIPGWKTNVSELPEPQKQYFRELGLAELLYIYGGLVVPNSFICLRNLISLYAKGIDNDKPFACEVPNKHANILNNEENRKFLPSIHFMGAPKRNIIIRNMVDYLKTKTENPHYTSESEFFGFTSKWLYNEVLRTNINLIDGIYIGTKTLKSKPVLIEDLLSEQSIPFCNTRTYGVLVPRDELLKRNAYNWFSVMSGSQILESNLIISDYLLMGIREEEEKESNVIKAVVAI